MPRSVYRELFALIRDLKDSAPDVRLPLMMVLSKDDRVIDTDEAARYFKYVGSNVKKLLMVESSGHLIPLDHDEQAVTELSLQFIREQMDAN